MNENILNWRFDVNTFRLIGRDLITDRITAVFELVKNGYDANAENVKIELTGIEIREEQAKLNQERVKEFEGKYICDDGQNVLKHIPENSQDLLFSCPPYFDLEVYSDLENDASNQETYEDFILILDNAFSKASKCLKENRFAVITVGDVRDKNGAYYCFPDDIKKIFRKNGFYFYNELFLVEPSGNGAMRAANQMKNRKVVKTHQNVLVFYKGDISKIKDNFPILQEIENAEFELQEN
jgi:DNA modification methylase